MNSIFKEIEAFSRKQPDRTALIGNDQTVCYAELVQAVQRTGAGLRGMKPRVVALALDNGPAWAVLDLAAMDNAIPLVPLPLFFSAAQVVHALRDSGANYLVTDRHGDYTRILQNAGIRVAVADPMVVLNQVLAVIYLPDLPAKPLPPEAVKITYTSGTTGQPKGVCLDNRVLMQVSAALKIASEAQRQDNHLSVLPLSTLLENIGGIYVPLLSGASSTLLPLTEVGLNGAAGLDTPRLCAALAGRRATTTILTPEMLRGLLGELESGGPPSRQLRFVAVGGAPVAPRLLQRARTLGLPVFEGYGLSECASVVALNTPHVHRMGSVGKPLPHVRLCFATDGEILVNGALFCGYTGTTSADRVAGDWSTGDIGYLDEQGFLYITGRKSNMFITSFGRNVAPEWVERELTSHPAIVQAAVFGEARPWNMAVIVPKGSCDEVDRALAEINSELPDYARVRQWIKAQSPFTPHNGQLTPNGRLRRECILKTYQATLDAAYEEPHETVL